MAKTSAQRQKEYRERKKTNDRRYGEKETARVMKYYVPRAQLNKKKLKTVQRKQREYEQNYHQGGPIDITDGGAITRH